MEEKASITCLCGKARQTVFLRTTLPATLDVCHCDDCRWSTGTFFYSGFPLRQPPETLQGLLKYNSSDILSRYFCSTCGTHLFIQKPNINNTWHVAAGVIERIILSRQTLSHPIQRIVEHKWLADTKDGGLAVCLAGSTNAPARFYMQGADEDPIDIESSNLFSRHEDQAPFQARLRAACHCGGVEFFLSRPDEKSRACSSPWPDLLRPYHSFDSANPDDVKWWIRSSDKFLAGTCACRSCRLGNSSPVTCWAFIPRTNLKTKDGMTVDLDVGTQQKYQSSKGRTRTFCRVCGASVFLRIDERPELLDISHGLFRAPEGARAESWFEWATDRVSFSEEGIDRETVETCEAGLKRLEEKVM